MMNESIMGELLAGGTAGSLGVFVGHPFDTVKVRLQNYSLSVYKNSWDCFHKIVRFEGIAGLFKGMASPLIGSFVLNAIVFCSYERTISVMNDFSPYDPSSETPLANVFVAGCTAGFLSTIALCPIDFLKCNLQINGTDSGQLSTLINDVRRNGIGRKNRSS